MINPLFFKAFNGFDWASNSVDVYGLQVSAKIGEVSVGGYGLWYNMGTFPMQVNSVNTNVNPGLWQIINGTQEGEFGWLGFYSDGKLGPVNYNFDFGYDYGKARSRMTPFAHSVQYNGWATRMKVDYPWEKANFGITGMYASGSDLNKTSSTGIPGSAPANNPFGQSSNVSGWMVPVGSEVGAVNGESAVFYGMEAGASGGQGWAVTHNYYQPSKGAFGGTWFTKLYGSYKVIPQYKVTVQAMYIGDTSRSGNTFGTAIDVLNPTTGNVHYRNDGRIGYELDLINDFQIYKNLNFKVFGGYLFAGHAMDYWTGIGTENAHIRNPWALRTRLMYTF